jgi:transcription elongation GreA/GreB family factor
MSRAFVKENDDTPPGGDLPERRISEHPNLVTPDGLAELEARADELEELRAEAVAEGAARGSGSDDPALAAELAPLDRDLRYFRARIASAQPVDLAAQPHDTVAFGARVTVRDEKGVERVWAIVGEDEADLKAGKVSYVSPLAEALLGARVGDAVVWQRPAGDLTLTVARIDYS